MSGERINDPITLRIDGVDWTYWKSVEITIAMDAIAGAFSIALADPWIDDGAQALPIAAGMACEVLIGQDPVINGYIDKVTPSFSASDHGISISGRDRSADLVDSSAVHKPGQWTNQTALQLAAILAGPFNVAVTAEGDIGAPLPVFKLEQGETAFEALDKALKQRELLAMPDGQGGLVLLKVGSRKSDTALAQGVNILSASADFDMTDRFSDYLVQGQQPGNDEVYGKEAAAVHAETRDEAVLRYRPLIVRAESSVDSSSAMQRAMWERTVRAARSVSLSATVQGFRQDSGDLWAVNAITSVDIPFLRLKQELLISSVVFKRDASSGSTTTLELKDPKAFQPEPKTSTAKGKASGGGSGKDAPLEADKDIQARYAEAAAAAHENIKEGR